MKLVYVAGRYRAKTLVGVFVNIVKAYLVARKLWKLGYAAICPHTNTFWMSEPPFRVPPSRFLGGDLLMVKGCDYVLMIGDWQKSSGARGEWHFAREHGIPVAYSIHHLLDIAGQLVVEQCKG